jgi:hypothetical protein
MLERERERERGCVEEVWRRRGEEAWRGGE